MEYSLSKRILCLVDDNDDNDGADDDDCNEFGGKNVDDVDEAL